MDPNTGHLYPVQEYEREKTSSLLMTFKDTPPNVFSVRTFNAAMDRVKSELALLPDGRAKSLALTKLDEAVLWITQATGAVAVQVEDTPAIASASR